ncbi:NAD(P)/FAD-dependent oxidoreductase [Yinghuangia seranimata]|uniref:NAD(P)/FAD-dependent oxidoreductase n=1 Tax=Yinghuangia seranimata TaxID=408067 RepID=UPI00248B484B|nr:NAD(P)/FAD-dependent oxidoreductase [Yinghuangia seranimata]MDI2129195.1 FAD-dependent oxidoreductase [Yinghuangia seranimata]
MPETSSAPNHEPNPATTFSAPEPSAPDPARDRELGMHRRIARRDFLNGMAVTAGTLAAMQLPGFAGAAAADTGAGAGSDGGTTDTGDRHGVPPGPYPPALTGLRGSQPGSFETAHAVRDGSFQPGRTVPTGERYDLIVVGGGISGLAAAYFFRERHGRDARILVLDNHDDFGGHARRNEFTVGGKRLLGYGGTQSIDGPATYSREAIGLIKAIGVDTDAFYKAYDDKFEERWGLGRGTFFNREAYGTDALVVGSPYDDPAGFAARTPLTEAGRADLVRLFTDKADPMPGLTDDEKKAELTKTSYQAYLRDVLHMGAEVQQLFQRGTHDLWGVGIDAVSALDCWATWQPGFTGLALTPTPYPGLGKTPRHELESEEPYIFHFPDGNASVARLLVRSLVPGSVPGHNMRDIVTARADYSALDRPFNRVRIRLGSTAVHVAHDGPVGRPRGVEVTYARDGRTYTVQGDAVVMACWNTMVPYLVPELPAEQRAALAYCVKVPLVYTNVVLTNWRAFARLGLGETNTPGMYWDGFGLDFPVSLGDYHFSKNPSEPVVVHVSKAPTKPGLGLPARTQHRAGRGELYRTTFETYERELRDMLARALGGGGFDPARDIAAITVNRWPHGYAYEYSSLWDPIGPDDELPYGIGRRTYGRIAIANADSAAYAYTDAAIDQAYRAVTSLTHR